MWSRDGCTVLEVSHADAGAESASKVLKCLCWWWDSLAGTSALLPGTASGLGADPVTCVSSLRGFLSVLLLQVLGMKGFVCFYLEVSYQFCSCRCWG